MPAVSEAFHPVPPQTSKRGGFSSNRILVRHPFSWPAVGRAAGCSQGAKTLTNAKRECEKSSKLQHRQTFRTLCQSACLLHFSAQRANVILWRNASILSAQWAFDYMKSTDLDRLLPKQRSPFHRYLRTTLTTYAMRVSPRSQAQWARLRVSAESAQAINYKDTIA